MRVIIRKHLISIFGSMEPGHIHEIPENIAQSWCRAGIAEAVNEPKPKPKPKRKRK